MGGSSSNIEEGCDPRAVKNEEVEEGNGDRG